MTLLFTAFSCSEDLSEAPILPEVEAETIVIFSINDPHDKIHNFTKIKAIIDKEKETESQVYFVSGGDIFRNGRFELIVEDGEQLPDGTKMTIGLSDSFQCILKTSRIL